MEITYTPDLVFVYIKENILIFEELLCSSSILA